MILVDTLIGPVYQRVMSQPINMQPAIDALKNLPGAADESERVYCAELANRMNASLLPEGISMTLMLLDYDVRRGVSGFTGAPLHPKLVGYPTQVYTLLGMRARQVLEAALPEPDRERVRRALDA